MKLHLHSRAYALLWKLWPRKNTTINGYDISYCHLPWWLLIGTIESKDWFPGGYCLTYNPTRKLMIFISSRKRDENLRYTLYHEYHEGRCWIETDRAKLGRLFTEAANLLKEDIPNLGEVFEDSIRRKGEENRQQHRFHLLALTLELTLAKLEMSPRAFSRHLAIALKDRL
jgi:hypothetical protein